MNNVDMRLIIHAAVETVVILGIAIYMQTKISAHNKRLEALEQENARLRNILEMHEHMLSQIYPLLRGEEPQQPISTVRPTIQRQPQTQAQAQPQPQSQTQAQQTRLAPLVSQRAPLASGGRVLPVVEQNPRVATPSSRVLPRSGSSDRAQEQPDEQELDLEQEIGPELDELRQEETECGDKCDLRTSD